MLQEKDNATNSSLSESLKRYVTGKTRTDLLKYAKDHYGIEWKHSLDILKAAGFEKWNPELWLEYLGALREHWPYLIEARKEEARQLRMARQTEMLLIELANRLKWVEYPPGNYHWEGSEESFKAHDQLAALERERNIKKVKLGGTPISQEV